MNILSKSKIPIIIILVGFIILTSFHNYASGGLSSTIGGTQGTGNGQFDQPWGLGVNSTGHIFVVEY